MGRDSLFLWMFCRHQHGGYYLQPGRDASLNDPVAAVHGAAALDAALFDESVHLVAFTGGNIVSLLAFGPTPLVLPIQVRRAHILRDLQASKAYPFRSVQSPRSRRNETCQAGLQTRKLLRSDLGDHRTHILVSKSPFNAANDASVDATLS